MAADLPVCVFDLDRCDPCWTALYRPYGPAKDPLDGFPGTSLRCCGCRVAALDEVAAEKLRCIAERAHCRDLYDLHELLDDHNIDVMETWHLYLRKAPNDVTRGRQRTPSREWVSAFDRRLSSYPGRWDQKLGGLPVECARLR
jgi:hypothetical protein